MNASVCQAQAVAGTSCPDLSGPTGMTRSAAASGQTTAALDFFVANAVACEQPQWAQHKRRRIKEKPKRKINGR